jgi:flavodoxin
MKTAIIYYSYSGNTRKLSGHLCEYLKQRGEVDLVELKAQDESDNFFRQGRRALLHKRAKIEPINFDLGGYDLICFGTPLWAFAPAPAMNTCLDGAENIQDKEIVLFTTYGSGTGNNRCLKYMQKILVKKGARDFKSFSLPGARVNDANFVNAKIRTALPK